VNIPDGGHHDLSRLRFRLVDELGVVHSDVQLCTADDVATAARQHGAIAKAVIARGLRVQMQIVDPDGVFPTLVVEEWEP
jgi:uncharacterized membrane protein